MIGQPKYGHECNRIPANRTLRKKAGAVPPPTGLPGAQMPPPPTPARPRPRRLAPVGPPVVTPCQVRLLVFFSALGIRGGIARIVAGHFISTNAKRARITA